jgi:Zn-dependent M28 family amino/carboxypeptidase
MVLMITHRGCHCIRDRRCTTASNGKSPSSFNKGVIFSFWSGEELGLIGSTHFANQPPMALDRIHAYLNFDMVGRMRENRLTLQGIGSSTDWKPIIERGNIVSGFQLTLQEDPYLPTDTTAFYPQGNPCFIIFHRQS